MQLKSTSSLIKTASVFIVVLALFVISIPYLLSTSLGPSLITSIANRSIPGKIAIEDIDLSWFGSQKIKNFSLYDTSSNMVIACEEISLDDSLFTLLFHGLHQGKGHLKGLQAEIVQDQLGNSTLAEALSRNASAVNRESVQTTAVFVKGVESEFNLSPSTDQTNLFIHGFASQGDIEGEFSVNCQIKGLDKSENLQALAKMGEISLKVDVSNLPVDLIDQFATLRHPDYRGLIRSALGRQLNLKIDSKTVDGKAKLAFNAKSENLEASITGGFSEDEFIVENAGRVNFLFTQLFYDRLFGDLDDQLNIKLQSPSTLSFVIDQCKLPLKVVHGKAVGVDIKGMSLQAHAQLGASSLVGGPAVGLIEVDGLSANVSAQSGSDTLNLDVSGKAQHNGQPIKIAVKTSIPKNINPEKFIGVLDKGPLFEANLTGIPLGLIDKIAESDNLLENALGQLADITIYSLKNGTRTDFALQLKTEKLSTDQVRFTLGNQWELVQPVQLIYKLDPNFANAWIAPDLKLQSGSTVVLDLQNLSIPRSSQNFYKTVVNGKVSIDNLQLVHLSSEEGLVVNGLTLNFESDRGKAKGKLSALVNQISRSGPKTEWIGKDLRIESSGDFNITSNSFKANSVGINIANEILNITASAKQSDAKTWVFTSPINVNYTLTNPLLASLGSPTKLASPSVVHIEIDTPQSPLNSSTLKTLKLNGALYLDYLELIGMNSEPVGTIKNLKTPFKIDAIENKINLQLSGVTSIGKQNPDGSIDGEIAIENLLLNGKLDPKNATVKTSLRLSKLPVGILDTLFGTNDLIPILGKAVDLKLDSSLIAKAKNKGHIDISVQGDQWNATASLVVTDAIRLKTPDQPATLSWTMTPARFAALRKIVNTDKRPERLVLLDTAHVHTSIRSLEIPLREIDWISTGLSVEFLIDTLNIQDKRYSQRLNFEGVIAHADSKALSQKIDVRLTAKQKEDLNKFSDLTFFATLDNLIDGEGKFNKKDLSVALEAKASQLPASTLCELAGLDPAIQEKLIALTGPQVNADVKVELRRMNGPVKAFLQGNNGYISLDGFITNSTLTLKNPFEAVVTVTPELGQTVLQAMIPLLSGSLGADKPLRIGIAPEGFSMPLKEFNINDVQVGRASIEMGVMYFKNEGPLAKILGIFTPSNSEQIVVWFTPAYFNIDSGIIKLERMDMLVMNAYPIALWGIVNLPNDKIDMTVGLSAQSLKKAFNLPTLDKKYMMTLPYRGKIGKASIDKTKITTKISALTAQVLGGPQGFVIGTAIQLATAMAEDPVPPPTTDPLPWNNNGQTVEENSEPSMEERKEQRSSNPLKQVQKGAGSLLKNLFR